MARGYLLLVLHCHLPYVRHPEHDDFLEEDWFYEAVAETYVPLLRVLQGLDRDRVPFKLALSVSPTLCEMLGNKLLRERCARYLRRHVELADKEVARTRGTPFADAARLYQDHYRDVCRSYVDEWDGRLLDGLAKLARRGKVELLGSAATHAVLPLLGTEEGRRAQVAAGLRNFEKHFGRRPAGFWLPECGYARGVDGLLARFGIRFFFLDTHGVLLADPRPPLGVFAPLQTPSGAAAFGRDVESSEQVWSADEGYPGDPAYREFHRDLGYDAELDYVRPYLHADGVRRPLGFKYHRVTGSGVPLGEKQPYDPGAAAERAAAHAGHFVRQRADQARRVRQAVGVTPVIVSPYDAELFGHWWFEGVRFVDHVFRQAAGCTDVLFLTPSEYLARCRRLGPRVQQSGEPAPSSWGNGGYFDVWVDGSNDWIYPDLHRAEAAMVRAAGELPAAEGLLRRALNQCARLLMLAQSSDWPFLMHTGTAREYATARFRALMDRFGSLSAQVRTGRVDAAELERCEWLDDAFPEMDYRVFRPPPAGF